MKFTNDKPPALAIDAPGAVSLLVLVHEMTIDMTVGEKSVNPLRDEASLKRSGNQKKNTHFVGLFFLPAFGRYCAFGALHLRRPPPPNQKKIIELQVKCKRVDIAIVRREKALVHIVNVRWNCKRKILEFLVLN